MADLNITVWFLRAFIRFGRRLFHARSFLHRCLYSSIWMTQFILQGLIATPKNDFKEHYRSTSVLFQMMFDHELLLDGIPRKVILPWELLKTEVSSENIFLEDRLK